MIGFLRRLAAMDRRRFAGWLLSATLWHATRTQAQDAVDDDEPSTGHLNAISPTLGGKQFWADELFFHDWHIQRNVFTGHYRLLDGYNLRHAWGTYEDCRNKLEQIKLRRGLPPMQGRAVVALHGLFRTASSMNKLCRYLREEGGYTVFNVSYPTTRGSIAEHAQSLDRIIDNLHGISEINFVGHSLGNLVVRHYLGDHTQPEIGLKPDSRIKRIVMLGPPNQGAPIAEALDGIGLFHVMAGTAGGELSRHWQQVQSRLATPECEFGIVAGGRSKTSGYNPWLPGDNDLVVGVEDTKLAGAADFAVLPVLHSFMMNDPTVLKYTLQFLEHGYFVSAATRNPLPRDADKNFARARSNVEG
jgi:pimeloyl-ACP methyl ester carboxylesterase